MKRFTTRFLASCGILFLALASISPFVASAQLCPSVIVDCGNGKWYSCAGVTNGDTCSYDRNCVSGGKCGKGEGGFEPVEPIQN
jgi:hypothetical protein